MNVVYDITQPHALNLGHQFDHKVLSVTFDGFVPIDPNNTIYLKFGGLGLYPLLDMTFEVSEAFTSQAGTFKGQLVEVKDDNSLVQNSKVFNMMVKPSLYESCEIVSGDADLDLWFTQMSELYEQVLHDYTEGTLVTYDNVTAALGYVPANTEDIPVVPTDISAFNNDVGYITEITSEDVINALEYVPADVDDIPVVPNDISSFNNDVGYITGITSQDISDALGYIPADESKVPEKTPSIDYKLVDSITLQSQTNSIVRTVNLQGNPYDYKYLTVILKNESGLNGGTNSYMFAYDKDDNVIGGTQVFFYAPSNAVQSVVKIVVNGQIVEMESVGWTAAAKYNPVNKSLITDLQGAGDKIAKIEINSNGGTFKSGTIIDIYGV